MTSPAALFLTSAESMVLVLFAAVFIDAWAHSHTEGRDD